MGWEGGHAETCPRAPLVWGAHGSEGSSAGSPGCAGWGGGPGRPRARPREQPHLAQAPTSSCATSHLASLCRLCHHGETGHGTASVPRDTLIVRPSGAGFELVARAPEEGGVVTWRKKTSLAPRRGRHGKMLSRTSSARTQGGAGAGVLFGSAGWLGARTGPSGPCPCSPCGGCPLPLGGSLADQRGLPGGTRAGQSLGRCSSAT